MNDDLRRLCKAANRSIRGREPSEDLGPLPVERIEDIVRAILTELKTIPSEEAMAAIADAVQKPRQHVGHRGSDQVQTAIIGITAYLNAVLGEPL